MVRTRDIVILGGLTVVMIGGSYLLKLNRLSNKLESTVKGKINKISLTNGIELRIDVTLKNPTSGEIRIKYPFVVLEKDGNTIASSESKDLDFKIPKFGQVQIDPIYVQVPFTSFGTNLSDVYKQFKATGKISIGKIKLRVRTETTINNKLPYTRTDDITI